ncbi:polysaccharide deacetylase family protein [Hydrogenimonas cancrithermarum]|uniref:NodB homology domain-containing protein n=1 Tax=Hydrogenimonas cancrithermarum TaxID=2993563 RepID=A0ABM8FME3_9BACT|nr:polysaccharide deacetylase family protein [Hydrogenimonas cancrithermarum]BDY13536.1 hypothetical protein HCR_18480 [Hydrogenimonas cancrithermarum]
MVKNAVKTVLLHTGALLYGNQDSKVIYYHDIHDNTAYTSMSTPIKLFLKHLETIQNMNYTVVQEITNRKNEIEITFDDGFRGLYENFLLLIDRKIHVKLFLVTDFIDKKNYLTKGEIEEMLGSGYLSIGSHSVSHQNLDLHDRKRLIYELEASKKKLEDLFDRQISSLCFPRGRFSDLVIEESEKTGYSKLYSCLPGSYFSPYRKNLIPRSLAQHALPSDFSAILNGGDQIYFKRYLKMHYRNGDLA